MAPTGDRQCANRLRKVRRAAGTAGRTPQLLGDHAEDDEADQQVQKWMPVRKK